MFHVDLKYVLGLHARWLSDEPNGERADLSGADLRDADLRLADLRDADLSDADLRCADLRCADLRGANLSGADLRYANLSYADFRGADLRGTCLDPRNIVPDSRPALLAAGIIPDDNGWCIAYRTLQSRYIGNTVYLPGRYTSPVFSTAETECHPGIYVASLEWLRESGLFYHTFVEVKFHYSVCHAAGDKFRCKEIWVL